MKEATNNMSFAKELLDKQLMNGYSENKKHICCECFHDKYIKKIIYKNGETDKCYFCGKRRKTIELTNIFELFRDYINENYQAIENYPSLEDESEDIEDILRDIFYYVEIEDESIIEEFLISFDNRGYISNDRLYKDGLLNELTFEWKEYNDFIKELDLSPVQIVSLCKKSNKPKTIEAINNTISTIVTFAQNCHLIKTVDQTTKFYRCVKHLNKHELRYGLNYIPATLVGTAPSDKAATNRMSDKGDEYFYGGLSKNIAKKEAIDMEGCFTIGTFILNKKVKLLDLSEMNSYDIPSILDIDQSEKYQIYNFLDYASREISNPYISENKTEYKPIQVFAKYIQEFTDIKGIIYRSAKSSIEKCVVLFVDNINCIDKLDQINKNKTQLIMVDVIQE